MSQDKSYTLIATLGLSPGAVTGLYDALTCDMNIFPDRVHLLMTDHKDVKRSANVVNKALQGRYEANPPLVEQRIFADSSDMDLSRRLATAFQKMVLAEIRNCLEEDRQLIIGITGGRVSMGAMLAVGAHLYSEWIQGMYHVWVDSDIERQGTIDNLSALERARLFDQRREILFPAENRRKAVWLPVYNLGPKRGYVEQRTTLELRDDPNIDREMADSILYALPGRVPIAAAEQYAQMLQSIADGADPRIYVGQTARLFYEYGGLPMAREHIDTLYMLAERRLSFNSALREFASRAQDESPAKWFRPFDWLVEHQEEMEAIKTFLETIGAGVDVLTLGGLMMMGQYFQMGIRSI